MSEDNLNQSAEETREPAVEAEAAQAQADVEVTPAQTLEPAATTEGVAAMGEPPQAAEQPATPEPSAEEPGTAPKAAGPEGTADYDRSFPQLERGGVIKGTVVHIDREGVLVDVGAKSEGIIKPGELSRDAAAQAEDVVSVGEEIDVLVLEAESADGSLLLSKKRADFEKAWDRVIEAKETGKTLKAMVTDRVKGGLVVDLGIRGFVPASHVGTGSPKTNLDRYVGQTIPLKVIEVDKERRKVVLSNREAEEEEKSAKKHQTAADLKVGQVRRGVVRRLTTYGAFVDLGGIDGLLHISEMSWTRINSPADVLKEGQEINVMILKLDLENGRVSLSLREILPDPWSGIEKTYHVGDTVRGTVARIVPFGAFVQVKNGVEGILPNSEISSRRGTRASDVLTQGEEVEVKVIDLRPEERKLTLSLRQARQEEETRHDRKTLDDYQSRSERDAPRYTIGDAMKAREEEKDS